MAGTLLDKVEEIQLKGGAIKDSIFDTYKVKVEASSQDCCYGADCGDCDDGDGYCIDP